MLGILILPAIAAEDPPAEPVQVERGQEVVVTAPFERGRRDQVSSISVLEGAALDRALRPQLGDALQRLPGVSATSFGPNASRPVLRGLGGERIRVLTDGIGAFDVSNTSADHAVAINPLLAERIEVLRGPASLRYGSSAIGGVVNVVDRRIPLRMPERSVKVDALGTLGSAARERAIGTGVVARISDQVALRVGGGFSETDDLRTGGFVLAEPLRGRALASADPGVQAIGRLTTLPNSAARTWSADAGVAMVNAGGTIGASLSRYESVYHVPVRFALTPGAVDDPVTLDAKQTRADVRAGIKIFDGPFERLTLRGGYADYAHVEFGADGAAGTLFTNEAHELRAELSQRSRGGWRGISGVQIFDRDFAAIGDEQFVPPNRTDQIGAFTVQEIQVGRLRIEGGARVEQTSIVSRPRGFDRSFMLASWAIGGFARLAPGWRAGVNLSSTARAPSPEELLANGPHEGTQAVEIGDPGFTRERAAGIEAVVRGSGRGWRVDAAAYRTRFAGFISASDTGEVREGLPVFRYLQAPATFTGFEVEGAADLWRRDGVTVSLDALVDAVRATIDGFGPAPRIPPLRILGGVSLAAAELGARIEVERVTAQRRISPLETQTKGFTLLSVSVDWTRGPVGLGLSANNLLDTEARRHASFLKDYAPLAGRDVRLTLRLRR